MTRFDQELALPKTLLDICDDRVRVLDLVRQANELLQQAGTICDSIGLYGLPHEARPGDYEQIRHQLDAGVWRVAFDKTGFMQLMDAKAKEEFFEACRRKAPEFTEDTVRATFIGLHQTADAMFMRGMVNVFRNLSKDHRTNTNEPFKINERAILSYTVTPRWGGGLEIRHDRYDRLNDIDRVFKVLDGKQHQARALETAANGAFKDGNAYEDDYYQLRGFKNGNLHIKFKRADLLEKANKMIGDYYNGNALAKDRAA